MKKNVAKIFQGNIAHSNIFCYFYVMVLIVHDFNQVFISLLLILYILYSLLFIFYFCFIDFILPERKRMEHNRTKNVNGEKNTPKTMVNTNTNRSN